MTLVVSVLVINLSYTAFSTTLVPITVLRLLKSAGRVNSLSTFIHLCQLLN